MKPTVFDTESLKIISPIIQDEAFEKMKHYRQHMFFTRFEHLIHTAWLCERIAKWVWADHDTCVLAWLLHDFHETDIRGYEHGVIAAENAKKYGVSEEVLAMIRAHMFPLGLGKVPTPWTKNFWVLKVADFSAATVEYLVGLVSLSWNHGHIRFKKTHDLLFHIRTDVLYRR
jgi:putative nucleotidyltransferase with HDIG domain